MSEGMDDTFNANPETHFSWALGDDYDCDTCGNTWNEAELDLDWDGEGEGAWMFGYRTGCYGGNSVTSTEDGAVDKLEVLFKEVRGYPEWSVEIEKQIRGLLHL